MKKLICRRHCRVAAIVTAVVVTGCGGGSVAGDRPDHGVEGQAAAGSSSDVAGSKSATPVRGDTSPLPTKASFLEPDPSLPPPAQIAAPSPVASLPIPAALSNLQSGAWLQLPNTKIRSVLPSPVPRGDPRSLTLAWSGGTIDTARNRLLMWGGGHADYWGNEIYALNLGTLSVERLTDPSAVAATATCTSALSDNTPTSRHSYGGLTYIAHLDLFHASNGSLAPCGWGNKDTWHFDFSTGTWALATNISPVRDFGVMAVYDETTQLVYIKDQNNFFSYSPDTNLHTKLNAQTQYVDYHLSAAIDTKRRKFVMIGDGVKIIDLATNRMESATTINAPGLATSKQSPGVAYDPVADRIVAWHGGSDVYALNMDTFVWTQVAKTSGPTAAAPYQGTFGRWGYVPQYRVFALINDIDQNAWVFKLAN